MQPILFSEKHPLTAFASWLKEQNFSRTEVLVDQHTRDHCLPRFIESTGWPGEPLVIAPGEASKGIDTVSRLWSELLDRAADRNTLLINLGGGVVTDLGGFVASTYKRGISFAHIPTSLLGQVDAAIGYKTGIDFGGIKNSVGAFSAPVALVLDSTFLKTLPLPEYRSGMAEVFKHGLVADRALWKTISRCEPDERLSDAIIEHAAQVKMEIVKEDPFEKSRRKLLNFGHSMGHALESVALDMGAPVRHGEAVAAGMLMESWISLQMGLLDEHAWEEIHTFLTRHYLRLPSSLFEEEACLRYLRNDKKNAGHSIRMVLLEDIGRGVVHQEVSEELSRAALRTYPEFYPTSLL